MKISKLFAVTLQSKTRLIFFAIALTYNSILGFYLRDFLIIAPTLLAFYLLSAIPTLFLMIEIKSKVMRTVVYILLILIEFMNVAYTVYCRRVFPFLAMISLAFVFMYYLAFTNKSVKDKLLTKIYVVMISVVIITTLFSAYNFVYKQEDVSLTNGQATLWDTKTVELADEICADYDSDTEKVKAIYNWITHNFEYDYDCHPVIQYFNVRKTLSARKGICYDFAHLFAALCRSQNIPCYVVDGDKRDNLQSHHSWNRVYFDGSWWNTDITFDIVQVQKKEKLYGFRNIENAYSYDGEYYITKIY